MPLRSSLLLSASLVVSACGGRQSSSDVDGGHMPESDAGPSFDASIQREAGEEADAQPAMACVPGRSIGCVGPGGCSSNQVCNGAGTAYGPCNCAAIPDG